MPNLYRNESSDARYNAQRNLQGRTHYVDDDTLRWHKSRVLSSRHTDGGLLFAIVTSDALDMHNTKRGCRYVIFDIFGHVIARPDLENCYRRSEQATKAMWAKLTELDAEQITLAAIGREQQSHRDEMQRLCVEVNKLKADGKLAKLAA
jgi:hypothetical protein